jgi:hypothetical protein
MGDATAGIVVVLLTTVLFGSLPFQLRVGRGEEVYSEDDIAP